MTPNDDKISSFQLGVFVFNIILGVGILTLPSGLSKAVDNDGWILCILSGLLCILFAYFMCRVGEKYTQYGFVGTLKKLFGSFFGTILALPVLAYFFYFYSIEVRLFAETAKLYLLPNTPLEFIIFPLIILTVFLARSGVETIGRFYETVTPFILLVILILTLLSVPKSDYSNIRPILAAPLINFIKGLGVSTFAYSGFEILLVIFPYLRSPKKAFKAASTGLIVIIILYVAVTILCFAKFGVKETASLIYPTLSLIRASQVPGGFIERLEGLMLALWVTFVFTTLIGLLFALSVITSDILKHKRAKHIVSLSIPFLYIASLFGGSVAEVFDLSDRFVNSFGLYTIAILPLIMFIFSLFRKKEENKGGK